MGPYPRDSCHATMPNIGQGCGLAFEDGYVLVGSMHKQSTMRVTVPWYVCEGVQLCGVCHCAMCVTVQCA